jgi:sugar phosphate isomerase/epimerase
MLNWQRPSSGLRVASGPELEHARQQFGATRQEYATTLRLLRSDGYEGSLTIEHRGEETDALEGIAEFQEPYKE